MDNKLYEMMDWAAVEGIVYSEEDHPHDILGAHVTEEGVLIQTFLPTAKSVTVVLKDSGEEYPMDLEDEDFLQHYFRRKEFRTITTRWSLKKLMEKKIW